MKVPEYLPLITYINGALAVVFNIFLVFVILQHSSNRFGNYKYLMLIFAFFDMIYAMTHVITLPGIHVYKNSFIFFVVHEWDLSPEYARFLTAFFASLFAQSLFLLTLHFVFRYIQIAKNNWLCLFENPPHICILVFLYLFVAIDYGAACYYNFGPSPMKNRYFNNQFVECYDETSENVPYLGAVYAVHDKEGKLEFQVKDLIGLANISVVIVSTLVVMLTCGFKTYYYIETMKKRFNSKMVTMQEQLFRALLMQTLIPMIFTFFPSSAILISSIFSIPLGAYGNIVSVLLTVFPVLDPLVILYFVKSFRHESVTYFIMSYRSCKYLVRGSNSGQPFREYIKPKERKVTSITTRVPAPKAQFIEAKIDGSNGRKMTR